MMRNDRCKEETRKRRQENTRPMEYSSPFPVWLRYNVLTSILCFFTALLSAQQSQSDYNFVYRNWNNQTGLPQNTVYDMVKDSTGYLWGATEEGLFRFDGASFSVVDQSNTAGILSNTFYDLLSCGQDLWASGRNVIVRIRNKAKEVLDLRNYVNGGWIKCIEQDACGRLWIGTSIGKLYYLHDDSVLTCPKWGIETGGSVDVLKYTSHGMVIGTPHGLFIMKDPEASPQAIPYFNEITVTAIQPGQNNELWIGTANKGLIHVSSDTVQYTIKDGLNEDFISSLFFNNDGKLWIGLRSAGYQLFHDGKFITPNQKDYGHDGIRSILADEEDQLIWLGTNSSGLLQLKPALIGMPVPALQLSGKIILPIYQHNSGEIWVGTAGRGVNRFSKGKLTSYDQSSGLSNDLVLSLCGRDDYIYIGTSNGLDRFNRKTGTIDRHYTEKNGLQNNGVLCLFNDSQNRLWITTRLGGLHRMGKDDLIKSFKLPSELGVANLICAFEDSRHQIWLGTRGGGMIRINEKDEVFHYQQKKGFPADIVYDFFEDREGNLWMATEKGLVVYWGNKFRLFSKESGLLFNESYRILKDPDEYIWLSGNLGLQRIAIDNLMEAKKSTDPNPQLIVQLFNALDGMPNSEANGGFFPAGWAMQNGTLWFPTVQGVAVADNRLINNEPDTLNIHIQSLRYGNREYFPSESIQLPPGVYNFEVHYTSIDFSKAADTRFYYRLKGLNNEWTPAGNRHIAFFSALTPGNYTFEVKAERYGRSSAVATLHFNIQPYFYQTTWFRVLVTLLILTVILTAIISFRQSVRRNIREQQMITRAQITGQENERRFISAELHDSINQQLSTVRIYLDYAKTDEGMRSQLIMQSEEVIQNVIAEIRSLCNTLTPPSLKDIGLKEALEDLLLSYKLVGKFSVRLQFALDTDRLDEDLQLTLFRITQEQLNNIARHANARNVWLDFESNSFAISIIIRDDGQGFDPRTRKSGMGFENIQNRLSLYEGKVEIDSAPGKGCTLRLYIPRSNQS